MKKKYLIGIDSDGTAFDSMTVKQQKAFIPALLETWDLQSHADTVRQICEHINLYSSMRGLNRFIAIKIAFQQFQKAGIAVPDFSSMDDFLASERLSTTDLKEYLTEHDDPFLHQLCDWSCRSEQYIECAIKNLPPFSGVLPFLKQASIQAEIAVISTANEKSLHRQWGKGHLLEYVSRICGQESGSKQIQLQSASAGRFEPSHILMIGDAAGDYHAAQNIGAWFYPVIPGKENRSWELLRVRYLDLFFCDCFDSVQKKLLDTFYDVIG